MLFFYYFEKIQFLVTRSLRWSLLASTQGSLQNWIYRVSRTAVGWKLPHRGTFCRRTRISGRRDIWASLLGQNRSHSMYRLIILIHGTYPIVCSRKSRRFVLKRMCDRMAVEWHLGINWKILVVGRNVVPNWGPLRIMCIFYLWNRIPPAFCDI